MDRPILPRVERPVSRLILGQSAPAEVLPALYDRFVELGGNAFETARWYPTEPVLGQWLAGRADRGELFVATKGCHPAVQDGPPRVNPEAIRTDLTESLERLGLDRLDLFLLHRDDETVPVGEIMTALAEQRAAGPDRRGGRLELDHEPARGGERLGASPTASRRSRSAAPISPSPWRPGRRGAGASSPAIPPRSPGTPSASCRSWPGRRSPGPTSSRARRGGPGDDVRCRRPGGRHRGHGGVRLPGQPRAARARPGPRPRARAHGQPGRPGLGPQPALPDPGDRGRPDHPGARGGGRGGRSPVDPGAGSLAGGRLASRLAIPT